MIFTALMLVPLMLAAAFGVDIASWYTRVNDLQRAADSAALAGTVWMPNLEKATIVAEDSLERNGIVHGQDGISVNIIPGSTENSLRVEILDEDVESYFGRVVNHRQTLTRFAEAEYNLPLPLGSPLNYFGGDAGRTGQDPVTTYFTDWPTDFTTRLPANYSPNGCNMGTSSSQGLGRWLSNGTFSPAGHSGSNPQCRWSAVGLPAAGTSAIPPPDYTSRQPTNSGGSGCRVRTRGTSTPTLGRWTGASFTTSTSGTGSLPACVWQNYVTDPSTVPPFYNSSQPATRPCRVGYETSGGAGAAAWRSNNTFTPTADTGMVGTASADGNRLCLWTAGIGSNTYTPPNPIDASRSPGFWAAIEGPRTNTYQGDAYMTRCYRSGSSGSTCPTSGTAQNQMYQTGDDRGYWYGVKIPAGVSGAIALNVFDAAYTPGATEYMAGDRNLDSDTTVFPTQFQVYKQNNALDFGDRTAQWATGPNTVENSCNWSITNQADFVAQWRTLCTLTVAPGDLFLINVQTTGTAGAGVNGYALEAVRNNHVGTQPALYAYRSMAMQNNNFCSPAPCTPPPATFYLAEVGPQYAGKTLVMELYDSGDVAGGSIASMYPMMPATTSTNPSDPNLPKPVVPVPASSCRYTADTAPNGRLSESGTEYSTPQTSDYTTQCGIKTSLGGTSSVARFNGEWLRIRISIPSDYTCTLGLNPEVYGNSCWWGIKYTFSASANDVTTWQARVEGNPVHLTR
ncbi:MAG: pilus assembly protein TadG-related protein [Acidimicrobiia bacterium]